MLCFSAARVNASNRGAGAEKNALFSSGRARLLLIRGPCRAAITLPDRRSLLPDAIQESVGAEEQLPVADRWRGIDHAHVGREFIVR